jgi:Tol biopolymer transport system component
MNADPRIQERLRRAADPVSVDVEARLEGARRRAGHRQVERRIGTGLVAALIGAAALAAVWSLRLGQDQQPAVPAPTGTIWHMVGDEEWVTFDLYAFEVGARSPGTRVPWPGGETPLALPSFTPDGSQVAFLIDTGRRNERGTAPLFDVAVVRDGGRVEVLARDVDIVAEPEMGPNGEVAFVRRPARPRGDDELVIVAPDGTVGDPVATGMAMNALAWSPDGARIAVNGGVTLPDGRIAGSPIAIVSPDGTVLADVRLDLDLYPTRGTTTFDWSADGSTLAWTTYSDEGGTSAIVLMDADGSDVRVVTPEGLPADRSARYPIWAPEGDWLAFVSDRDSVLVEGDMQQMLGLYAMRADGSEVRTLIPPERDRRQVGPMMVDWLP